MNNLSQDIDLFKLFKKARLNLRKRTCITTIYLKTWIYELPDIPQLIHGIYLTKDIGTHTFIKFSRSYRGDNYKHIDISERICLESPGNCKHQIPHDTWKGAAICSHPDTDDSDFE